MLLSTHTPLSLPSLTPELITWTAKQSHCFHHLLATRTLCLRSLGLIDIRHLPHRLRQRGSTSILRHRLALLMLLNPQGVLVHRVQCHGGGGYSDDSLQQQVLQLGVLFSPITVFLFFRSYYLVPVSDFCNTVVLCFTTLQNITFGGHDCTM